MRRIRRIQGSCMGRQVVIRTSCDLFDRSEKHLLHDDRHEQFAFGLFSQARSAEGTVCMVKSLLIPGKNDLSQQSGAGIAPTKKFQAFAYLLAQQLGLGILDIHTHPFQSVPSFSSIDETVSRKNARYITENFAYPITHAMVVFGNDAKAHDAVVYDRVLGAYRTIGCLEILGRGIEIRPTGHPDTPEEGLDPQYDRQAMIPAWSQLDIGRQKIAVVGAGGNGAHIVQTLVSIGAGTEGWIAVIDFDLVEDSNLARIFYASPQDVGKPKVTVAAHWACQKNPKVKFYPYPCSITEKAAIDRLKAATIIIGAGDGDGLRKVCNSIAVRYMIPYIDLGCDIQVGKDEFEAGGQVRVVIPGKNACLVCCGGFDPAAAAIELMEDERAAVHAARGYVRGGRIEATPSVANLNAVTAQLGVAAFLALVHGKKFGNWDYAHYNQLTAETLVASTQRRPDCPLCGRNGIFAEGDAHEAEGAPEPKWRKMRTAE